MQNFLTSNAISTLATAIASTSAECNSTAVDTAGYDRVVLMQVVSGARIVKLQGGATATSATTDITGAAVTSTGAALVAIEQHRPQYRFIRMTTVTGAASVVGDTIAVLGLARSKPITNSNATIVTTTTD